LSPDAVQENLFGGAKAECVSSIIERVLISSLYFGPRG
jgi:hypothetical protein